MSVFMRGRRVRHMPVRHKVDCVLYKLDEAGHHCQSKQESTNLGMLFHHYSRKLIGVLTKSPMELNDSILDQCAV